MYKEKVACDVCGKMITKFALTKHKRSHKTLDQFINTYITKFNEIEDKQLIIVYLTELKKIRDYLLREDIGWFKRFVTTMKSVNEIPNVDFFFEKVKEWHLTHPKIANDRSYYYTLFPNDKEKAEKAYELGCRSKNPFVNHGGKLSPYSKKFIGYEKDGHEKYEDFLKRNNIAKENGKPSSNRIEHFLNKGMTIEEAQKALSERQCTFSLKRCIEKYGEEEGIKRFNDRQQKWQSKLLSKDPEEIKRINHDKASKIGSISKQEKLIKSKLNLNEDQCQKVISTEKGYVYDFCVENRIIEFNGDYWHCNPKIYSSTFYNKNMKKTAEEKWKLDVDKIKFAKDRGYEVMVVWENDLKMNPEKTIIECHNFLFPLNNILKSNEVDISVL